MGGVFFSLTLKKDILSFDLQENNRLKLGSKQIMWHQNQYILFDFPKCCCPDPKPIFTNNLIKHFYIEGDEKYSHFVW